jgi:DNA polymerase-3 subunit alpha
LLFERFLNPDRISMPDIDIDFDDDGRAEVLQWVTDKYGREKVAHIITFGTMAAKSAIKDVARVQNVSLSESDRLSKLIDEIPRNEKPTIGNAIKHVPAMKEALNSSDLLIADTIKYARMLEGTVRQTGVHACGVVIGRDDLTNYVPVSTAFDKDTNSDILVTQYEGSLIEDVGMMKMDFLGLKTLSIIKEALANIKLRHGEDLDIDSISIEDGPTYELYSKGETTGTFQFESDGMKKYLRELKPTKFEDLIAMNALYRPGPMDYIPQFIARKHGRQPITYDIPVMEERLKDTYGITVYQEQVMLLSRDLAGFTRGQSDELRKAMGKKLIDKMNALKEKFITGCKANGYDEKTVVKIWSDWESFASYAFNKSHATCYSWVAYQTAYLKANYPSEYMAAVLSRNISNITEITKFMDECKRINIEVLGPDVNESYLTFTVNKEGNIRFGLGAIKGVGGNAVAAIVEERNKNGIFKDIFDFAERVNLTSCNKKNMEALAQAGAFDNFPEIRREQFFALNGSGESFIEVLLRFGNKAQADKVMSQNTLFGGSNAIAISKPEIPVTTDWSILEKLNREKDLIGIYLSAHPLDPFRLETNYLTNTKLSEFQDLSQMESKEFSIAGLVTSARDKAVGKKSGTLWGSLVLEDFTGAYEFRFFGKDFENFRNYLSVGFPLFIRGTIQKNFRGELEPKIKSITMLHNVKNEMLKSLSLTLPLEKISSDWINELTAKLEENKGNTLLKFKILDPEENQMVEMFSRNRKVEVTNDFIDYLSDLDVDFKTN